MARRKRGFFWNWKVGMWNIPDQHMHTWSHDTSSSFRAMVPDQQEIEKAVKDTNFSSGYEKRFSHDLGLLLEEDPITTILIPERRPAIAGNMVLAVGHTPLPLRDIGAVKFHDTL